MDQQSEYFELLFNLCPDVIYSLSVADTKILRINPAFERITGRKVEDWVGESFPKLVHPSDMPVARERFALHLAGSDTSEPFILRIRHKTGKYITGEFSSVSLIRDGKVEEIIGIARDITARVETDKKLQQATAMLNDLLRQSHSY